MLCKEEAREKSEENLEEEIAEDMGIVPYLKEVLKVTVLDVEQSKAEILE
jgi:hypothetical protein